jgi:hypothetical protein
MASATWPDWLAGSNYIGAQHPALDSAQWHPAGSPRGNGPSTSSDSITPRPRGKPQPSPRRLAWSAAHHPRREHGPLPRHRKSCLKPRSELVAEFWNPTRPASLTAKAALTPRTKPTPTRGRSAENRPQRPDQRIRARRLTPGKPAGQPLQSYFRAEQPPPAPARPPVADLSLKRIKRSPVLGSLINEYERAA